MTRILVIRFSSIGDIILSAPVIQAIHRTYTDYSVDYLVHERFSPLVRHFDPPPDKVIPFEPGIGATKLPAFIRELAETDYDLVIDLHDSLRSKVIRRYFTETELRIYRKPRLKRWLLFNLWINRFAPDFSVVNEYLRYAGFEEYVGEYPPRLEYDDEAAIEICRHYDLDEEYLVCIPGAAWPQKSWMDERYVELFQRLLADSDPQVVLMGSQQDSICDLIAAGLEPDRLINLKGRTDLEEVLAVLSRCRLVIGSDTGLVHAGEALGKPTVMILGPTSRETGARLHHTRSHIHEVKLWCRPCSQNGRRRCYRRRQYCLEGISVEDVATSVFDILGQA